MRGTMSSLECDVEESYRNTIRIDFVFLHNTRNISCPLAPNANYSIAQLEEEGKRSTEWKRAAEYTTYMYCFFVDLEGSRVYWMENDVSVGVHFHSLPLLSTTCNWTVFPERSASYFSNECNRRRQLCRSRVYFMGEVSVKYGFSVQYTPRT